jgi:hypothetical protein
MLEKDLFSFLQSKFLLVAHFFQRKAKETKKCRHLDDDDDDDDLVEFGQL